MSLKSLLALVLLSPLMLTGCQPGGGSDPETAAAEETLELASLCSTPDCISVSLASCYFNGQGLMEDESVRAYLYAMDPTGACPSEQRSCSNGQLSGSYQYSSCGTRPTTCTFNGQTLQEGQGVIAYQNSSGSSCQSEMRLCQGGILSGSFSYAECTVDAPRSCVFNGQTIGHGASVTAYQNSSVGFGESCTSETRTCFDGTLTGSYTFPICEVGQPLACSFNGQTLAHGTSVVAFSTSAVPYGESCSAESRTCNNGVLNGSFAFASCTIGQPQGCLFDGRTLAHGEIATGYQNSSVPFGESCVSESRVCANGNLSGSYNFSSCSPNAPRACTFNGQTVAHGQTIRAFLESSAPFSAECISQDRTCVDGTLSGSYTFSSCNMNQPAQCQFNGQTVAHNTLVTAYQNSSVPFGQTCQSESRACQNGVLSGTYTFPSCTVGQPQSCLFDGRTIAHGEIVTAYQNSNVPFGSSCTNESRVCNNGQLSGSFNYSSCSANQPASCLFDGRTIAHGQTVNAYSQSSVPFGSTCSMQTRTCSNGVLSGSYTFPSCSVGTPKACTFNGKTVAHGQSVVAYNGPTASDDEDEDHHSCKKKKYCNVKTHKKKSRNCGGHGPKDTCESEVRTCNNGQLSGSFEYASCTAQHTPKACLFHGKTIAHGETIVAYKAQNSCGKTMCISQKRTCQNGKLTGNFTELSCQAEKQNHKDPYWWLRN